MPGKGGPFEAFSWNDCLHPFPHRFWEPRSWFRGEVIGQVSKCLEIIEFGDLFHHFFPHLPLVPVISPYIPPHHPTGTNGSCDGYQKLKISEIFLFRYGVWFERRKNSFTCGGGWIILTQFRGDASSRSSFIDWVDDDFVAPVRQGGFVIQKSGRNKRFIQAAWQFPRWRPGEVSTDRTRHAHDQMATWLTWLFDIQSTEQSLQIMRDLLPRMRNCHRSDCQGPCLPDASNCRRRFADA
jgi:hypothetical protein